MNTADVSGLGVAFAKGVKIPPLMTVSQWAAKHRVLTKKTSAYPGRWRNEMVPHAVEIMDRLSPQDPCRRVVVQKGVQMAITEIGNNWVGYTIHHDPCPTMVVQPTADMAKEWTQLRFGEMLETVPELEALVGDVRDKRGADNLSMKTFPGGVLVVVGANAPTKMRSKPMARVFFDEYESAPSVVATAGGKEEGDPRQLIERRAEAMPFPKFFYPSTPLIKGESRTETLMERSDKRRRWIPCPHCGHFQVLVWAQVKWEPGRPETAAYECEACEEMIGDEYRETMLAAGEWRPDPEAMETWDGETHGYYLPTLLSPFTRWPRLARQFLEAKDALDDGDPALMQVFVNCILGETWEERGQQISHGPLMDRREDFGPAACDEGSGPEVPAGVACLVCSVDTQDDRLEAQVTGWGAGEEGWIIDHQIWYGDPAAASGESPEGVWAELDVYLQRMWRHQSGINLAVVGTVVDSGGHHAGAVREFSRARAHRRVWAIFGSKDADNVPIWPKRPTRSKKTGTVYRVGVNEAKLKAYRRLGLTRPGPGFLHFSMERGEGYFQQLTAERRRTRYPKGRAVHYWWKPDHARNEAWDLLVYAYAALHALYSLGWRLDQAKARNDALAQQLATGQRARPRAERTERPSASTTKRSGYLRSRRSHWRQGQLT